MKKIELYLESIQVKDNGLLDPENVGKNLIGFTWQDPNFDLASKSAARIEELKDGTQFKYKVSEKYTKARLFRVKCEGVSVITVQVSAVIKPSAFDKAFVAILGATFKGAAGLLPSIASDAAGSIIDQVFGEPKDEVRKIGTAVIKVDEDALPEVGEFSIDVPELNVKDAVVASYKVKKPGNPKNGSKFKKIEETLIKANSNNGKIKLIGRVFQ